MVARSDSLTPLKCPIGLFLATRYTCNIPEVFLLCSFLSFALNLVREKQIFVMQYVQYNVFSGLSIRFQVAGGKPLEGGITSRKSNLVLFSFGFVMVCTVLKVLEIKHSC